jgi:hypothetical protein
VLGRQVHDLKVPPGELLDQAERMRDADPGTATDVVHAPDRGRRLHRSASGRDDVADISEVAGLTTVSKDSNRSTVDSRTRGKP